MDGVKFRDLVPLLASGVLALGAKDRIYPACVRSIMLYGRKSWPVKEEDGIILERNDARMARRMCDVRPDDRISAEELRTRLKLKNTRECLQDRRLHWFSHLERMEESAWSSKCRTLKRLVVVYTRNDQRKHGMR